MSGSVGDRTIKIWQCSTEQCITTLDDHNGRVRSSTDFILEGLGLQFVLGRKVYCKLCWWPMCKSMGFSLPQMRQNIQGWHNGTHITVLGSLLTQWLCCSFSDCSQFVVAGGRDTITYRGVIKVWNVQQGKCIQELNEHDGRVLVLEQRITH